MSRVLRSLTIYAAILDNWEPTGHAVFIIEANTDNTAKRYAERSANA